MLLLRVNDRWDKETPIVSWIIYEIFRYYGDLRAPPGTMGMDGLNENTRKQLKIQRTLQVKTLAELVVLCGG